MRQKAEKQIRDAVARLQSSDFHRIDKVRAKAGLIRKVFDKTVLDMARVGSIHLTGGDTTEMTPSEVGNLIIKEDVTHVYFRFLDREPEKIISAPAAEDNQADKPVLTQIDGRIATVTLNHPQKRNMLSKTMLSSLTDALCGLAENSDVQVLVIRGSGNQSFSSGFDINALLEGKQSETSTSYDEQDPLERAFEQVINFPYPVIAMMNGSAFGAGYELAVCCDIRIAADDIRVGLPPARIGIVYPLRGIQNFIKTIGLSTTKEMLFTGDVYSGRRLTAKRLVDYRVSRNKLEAFTYQMAQTISENAPLSIKGMKRMFNMLAENGAANEQVIRQADTIMHQALTSNDLKEGQKAVLEKRRPEFKGN